MKRRNDIIMVFVSLVIALLPLRFLVGSAYFPMHDDVQIARVVAMGNALKDGQFPVRMVSDLGYGYGYPLFNFYAPLPYYAGGSLYALGVSGLTATKLMFVLGFVLAGVSAYFMGRYALGRVGGIIASVLYVYAPYHAVQLYVRGAIGEMWAYGFLPFVVLGCVLLMRKRYGFAKQALALGIAGVSLSHLITAYVMLAVLVPALIMIAVFSKAADRKSILIQGGFGILIGLGLSSFYLLPAVFERSYTSVKGFLWDATDFRDHFVCPLQFWWSPWGYGGSSPGCVDGLSFELGKTHIIIAAGALLMSFFPWFRRSIATMIRLSMAGLFFFLFLMLAQSEFIWNLLPESGYIQYPWRLLSFAALFLSLAGAGMLYLIGRKSVRMLFSVGAVAAVVLLNGDVFRPQFVYQRSAASFEAREELRFRASGVSNEYLPPFIPRPKRYEDVPSYPILPADGMRVEYEILRSDEKIIRVISDSDRTIPIYIADFPGWTYSNNALVFNPVISDGFPQAEVQTGLNTIVIRFRDTPIRTISTIISMVTLGILIYAYVAKAQR